MRINFSLFICILLIHIYECSAEFQLGINLDDAGAFTNIINSCNRYSEASDYDEYGWPLSDFSLVLMDARPATEWTNTIDDPEKYRINMNGIYKCSFTGFANIQISGTDVELISKSYDSTSNTSYFDFKISGFPNDNHGLVFLNFSNTRRNKNSTQNDGITNLKVMRPGYELNSNKIFTDEFLNLCKSADFSCYRFYNLQNIWDGEPIYPQKTKWENRKTPKDASQNSMKNLNGKLDAWCWEYIVELSNLLNKDIWINIHISCDSTYLLNLAAFLKSNLNPNINIYLENSNEVWSPSQATHGPYNKAQADNYKISFDENYARRSVEITNLFAEIFGTEQINKRIRTVLAGQHAYNGRSDIHLNYIDKTFGEPNKYIYATSTALYFQSTKSASSNPEEINDGMIEDISSQISNNSNSFNRFNHINKASKWQLAGGCTSYEGGPHLPSGANMTNLSTQILSHRTAKMKDVLKYNYIEGWKNIGGGLAMYFTLFSEYNRYGCWGLTDDYNNPDRNFKMAAIREIINDNTDIIISDNLQFSLSPNPVKNMAHVIIPQNLLEYNITIYNLLGHKLIDIDGNSSDLQIDISSLTPGLYMIRIDKSSIIFIKE